MTISQGRAMKPMNVLLNNSLIQFKQHEECFTLGNVVDQLHSKSEKMVAGNVKKAAILESLRQASRHDIIACGEAKDSLFKKKLILKSLHEQIKNEGRVTFHEEPAHRQLSARKPRGANERASSGRSINSSLSNSLPVNRNGTEKKYLTKAALNTMGGKERVQNQTETPQSFYSRHMSNVESNLKENLEIDVKKFSATNNHLNGCLPPEIHTPVTISEDQQYHLENDDYNESQDVFLSISGKGNCTNSETYSKEENISSKEKEVLNSLTDPQLKQSLQNIIQRRRSSVRFFNSDSGYEMNNVDTIHSLVEQTPEEQHQEIENQREKPASSDTTRSVKSATSRKVSANRERLPSAATSQSGSERVEVFKPRLRKTARQEQNISPVRRVSSARSCFSAVSQRSLSSPILQRRKPTLQTGETRIIRPATAKGYVPNLTDRKTARKQSAMSCAGISLKKRQAKDLAEVNMIREFLLMYAKVTTKPRTDEAQKPVRMISETPELVIKSAIGQFLTCAFPSGERQEWTGLSGRSIKERYEEQQRSKLLRIKICMKHLAAVA
ncbi:unnamed protein product [Porites evermanni]|uniref:Uncharacterized protein n=1 Tax=Porites evermanni TaxID=104178 RepID=A0ABN8MBT0_9CNID|nr:unnamed protein product [Porites evermanni]